ncbi:hypothetical protein GmRootV213_50050 (plasmid) [Variovorax sp. V213]
MDKARSRIIAQAPDPSGIDAEPTLLPTGADLSSLGTGALGQRRARAREFSSTDSFTGACQSSTIRAMSMMNISLPDTLKAFVDEQVEKRAFDTSSE